MLKKWEDLPDYMRTPDVKPYYDALKKKQFSLFFKRVFDYFAAMVILIVLAPVMLIITVLIKLDSKGKHFRIHKFRTMVSNADQIGSSVTVGQDSRITRMGQHLRDLRLDELPQLFDVLQGSMSFVGTRPEAVKYVERYKPEYYATLLLPAGITSEASIRYKDEAELLDAAEDVDRVYVEQVLPGKMKWNLDSVKRFGFLRDIATMFRTVAAVLWKDYSDQTEQTEINSEVTVNE